MASSSRLIERQNGQGDKVRNAFKELKRTHVATVIGEVRVV